MMLKMNRIEEKQFEEYYQTLTSKEIIENVDGKRLLLMKYTLYLISKGRIPTLTSFDFPVVQFANDNEMNNYIANKSEGFKLLINVVLNMHYKIEDEIAGGGEVNKENRRDTIEIDISMQQSASPIVARNFLSTRTSSSSSSSSSSSNSSNSSNL